MSTIDKTKQAEDTSTAPAEHLFEVMVQFHKLSDEDARQLRILQKEKALSPEAALKSLEIFTAPEIYCFQLEALSQVIVNACGWNEGQYQFQEGEKFLTDAPMFDLNPLELIYQGVKKYHSLNLAQELQAVQARKVRLTHGWEQALALPSAFYEHSDVLDRFEQETTVGESIPPLHQELGDLNEALLFLYLLLITGLLEFTDQESAIEPEVSEPEPEAAPQPEAPANTAYISTRRMREQVAPTAPRPAESKEKARRQAAAAVNLERQVAEVRGRIETLEKELQEASNFFEALGIDEGARALDIQKAYARLKNRCRLEPLPAEAQAPLWEKQKAIEKKLNEMVQVLTDAEARMAYEQSQFQEDKRKAWNIPLKQKLAQVELKRGQWYLETNRPEFACRRFEQAVELDPEQPLYYAYVGWAYYRSPVKDMTQARSYLRQALQVNPALDQAHYFMGIIAKREGDEALADHHFHKAVEANPKHAQAQRELDLICSHQKQEGLLGRLFGKSGPKK